MSVQSPVPLQPDVNAMRAFERRSFMRAAAAAFIGHRDREDPSRCSAVPGPMTPRPSAS
jgi:hypothetical protein